MAANSISLIDPEMKEILDSFLIETKEILEQLDLDLVLMENKSGDSELLNKIFRSFHTIKGTSGFLGLSNLTALTHKCEDILNRLRKKENELDRHIMDSILEGYDKIKELMADIESGYDKNIDINGTLLNLQATLENMQNIKKEESADGEKKKIKKNEKKKVPDSKKNESPEAEKSNGKSLVNKENDENKNIVTADNSIRVDIERLDKLLNIASELVLGRNRLIQVNSEFAAINEGSKTSQDLSEVTRQIDLMTNELQLIVMKTRMVKIGKTFNRYPRIVRDLAIETKKKVNLVMEGEETELDKTLIEEINDPLIHLIRNAVDHGIELPEDRIKAGKPETGTITLSAVQEGNHIIVEIKDDGKGVDPEIIKQKAVAKGIITQDKANELLPAEIYSLLFLPGFSTADEVTNISGRGVGMDVVKTNVTKLRGLINIDSVPGSGTKIIIMLPLTLAIIPGMIVEVKDDYFVVPLNSVIEVVRVDSSKISTINQREVIRMRDKIIPLLNIEDLTHNSRREEKNNAYQYVVIVGIAEKIFGIKVDKLIGQKEIVIKSLGEYLGNIEGIAGSTIMGDGRVIMILDLAELINKLEL